MIIKKKSFADHYIWWIFRFRRRANGDITGVEVYTKKFPLGHSSAIGWWVCPCKGLWCKYKQFLCNKNAYTIFLQEQPLLKTPGWNLGQNILLSPKMFEINTNKFTNVNSVPEKLFKYIFAKERGGEKLVKFSSRMISDWLKREPSVLI